mmetsp:Transcript_122749/g.381519  ORF Transcript_122749/g.381519 Transcript_122749/m.381519 type:complete len:200 (-) Transcript_122749:110-709(-)
MDGDILVAPVTAKNSSRNIYFPEGAWYSLRASEITQSPLQCKSCSRTLHHPKGNRHRSVHLIQGPVYMGGTAADTEVPAFVRAGTVLPLAPVVQYTDALPGGPLEVQVYAGADGSFDLVEDDGLTYGYQAGTVRRTHLVWDDAAGTLSWKVTGDLKAPGPQAFVLLYATLFDKTGIHRTEKRKIGEAGLLKVRMEAKFV